MLIRTNRNLEDQVTQIQCYRGSRPQILYLYWLLDLGTPTLREKRYDLSFRLAFYGSQRSFTVLVISSRLSRGTGQRVQTPSYDHVYHGFWNLIPSEYGDPPSGRTL